MQVRLLSRWGSRMQGDVVSVSAERAKALRDAGIGKIIGAISAEKAATVKQDGESANDLAAIKDKLTELGVSFGANIGLEKARERLAEALKAKESAEGENNPQA